MLRCGAHPGQILSISGDCRTLGIAEAGENRMGDVLDIHKEGDPVLRKRAKAVPEITRGIRRLLDDMLATMCAADGVGLAAPQVGVSKRIIVVDVGDGPVELVNPEITGAEGEQVGSEGCLSLPLLIGEVARAKRVSVTGLNRKGQRIWLEGEDLFARVLQHEIDHLEGILFIDRATRVWEVPPETSFKIVFMGSPAFAVPILDRLAAENCRPAAVVTRPDRPRGRGRPVQPTPVKDAALRLGIEVYQPFKLTEEGIVPMLEHLAPDVILTAAYGALLPRRILDLPRLGCFNVHPSLLPRYRGPDPIRRAIINGDERTGVTIMHMTEELDAGDIVLQEETEIRSEDTFGSLEVRLAGIGATLVMRTLRLLATEGAPRRPQDPARVTFAPVVSREEERIDWSRPATAIVNLVRGLSPLPGAYTLVGGERLKIMGGRAVPGQWAVAPGRVAEVRPGEGFLVAAGEGAVLVLAVKPENGREMTAADYLNGRPLRPGAALGVAG